MAKKHCRKETRYVSVLAVHVSGAQSLVDMLRYDRCCPATEDESRKIWRLLSDERGDGGVAQSSPDDHVIRLHRFAASDVPATEARWRSFNCRVLDERSPDATPITDAEAIQLLKFKEATER